MTTLEKLLGSEARVRVIRFFVLNQKVIAAPFEVARCLRISSRAASREIRFLLTIHLLKKDVRVEEIKKKNNIKKKRVHGVSLDKTFLMLDALRRLVLSEADLWREHMVKYFKHLGRVQVVALGGFFLDGTLRDIDNEETAPERSTDEPRLDVLIIANGIQKSKIDPFIQRLESEIGKGLVWGLFSRTEFEYRMAMHDKLLRDLFDYPHDFLINKLGLE